MSELTEFLMVRIGEDEAVARAGRDSALVIEVARRSGKDAARRYWATFDPARVLAECAAKRRILAEHPLTTNVVPVMTGPTPGYACDLCARLSQIDADSIVEDQGACNTLRALASVYAGADGWREEWA